MSNPFAESVKTLTGRERTAAARAARTRLMQERKAGELNAAGWLCIPPHQVTDDLLHSYGSSRD